MAALSCCLADLLVVAASSVPLAQNGGAYRRLEKQSLPSKSSQVFFALYCGEYFWHSAIELPANCRDKTLEVRKVVAYFPALHENVRANATEAMKRVARCALSGFSAMYFFITRTI